MFNYLIKQFKIEIGKVSFTKNVFFFIKAAHSLLFEQQYLMLQCIRHIIL